MKVGPISVGGGGGRGPEGAGGRPIKTPEASKAPKVEAPRTEQTVPDHRVEQADVVKQVAVKEGDGAALRDLSNRTLPPVFEDEVSDPVRDAQLALHANVEASRIPVTDADVVVAGEPFTDPDEAVVAAHAEQLRPLKAALGPELSQQAAAQMEAAQATVATTPDAPIVEAQVSSGPDTAALAEAERVAAEQRTRAYMEVTQQLSADIDPNAKPEDIIAQINANKTGDDRWNPTEETLDYIKGAQQFKRDKLAAEAPPAAAVPGTEPAAPTVDTPEPAAPAAGNSGSATEPSAPDSNPAQAAAVNPGPDNSPASPPNPNTATNPDSGAASATAATPPGPDSNAADATAARVDTDEPVTTPENTRRTDSEARADFLADEKNKKRNPELYDLLKKAADGDPKAQELLDDPNNRLANAKFLDTFVDLSKKMEEQSNNKDFLKKMTKKEKEAISPKNPNRYKVLVATAYVRSTTPEDIYALADRFQESETSTDPEVRKKSAELKNQMIDMMGQDYFNHFEKLLSTDNPESRAKIAADVKGVVAHGFQKIDREAAEKAGYHLTQHEDVKDEDDKFLLLLKVLGAAAVLTGVDMADLSTGGVMKKTIGMN